MIFFTRNPSFRLILNLHSSTIISSTRPQPLNLLSTAAIRQPSPKLSFIAAYLISSVGFSSEKAIEASKQIRHIKTPSKPDAVLQFLVKIGLDNAGIRKAISRKPTLLCAKVEKTLKPKVEILKQAGFSEPEIAQLISVNPFFLHYRDLHTKIEFLGGLFSSKGDLFKVMISNTYLLCSNLNKRIMPNVSYLKTCGLPREHFVHLIKYSHRLLTRSLDSIKDAVQQAIELGFSPESRKFYLALQSTCRLSRPSMNAKVKALRNLGFSEDETSSAIMKAPQLLFLSVENIKSKVHFFVKRAGCELSYVISHPILLCYIFEKRLIPRNHVLQVLKSIGLPKQKCGLNYCITINDRTFTDKFILPYLEEIPDLNQVFLSACTACTACTGKVPMEYHLS